MSLTRTMTVLRKDLRLGPRSPVFLWVLLLPLLITFVLQVAFGSLFDPQPRLGVVDEGSSSIPGAVASLDGIELTRVDDRSALRALVESNDLDAGLVLPARFDELVREGARPALEFYIGGRSLASNRIILTVTAIDLVRQVEGRAAPVDVRVVAFGDDLAPLAVRLVPFVTMYALLIAGVFLPSFSLADERERHTLDAVVVTPTRLSEIVLAKGVLGFSLSIAMALVTLWLNGALDARPLALIVVLFVAGLLLTEVGLVYGTASKDVTGVFTLIKGTGFVLLGPTVFYIFPDWPQWIARLFPTYWVIDPVYQVTINGAGLGDVVVDLAIAVAIVAAMVVPIRWLTRRLETQLAVAA